MLDLVLIPPAQWEIREAGILGLVGYDHITIRFDPLNLAAYEVRYKGQAVAGGRHGNLADAKVRAMTLPALLLDFGMDA